VLAQHDVGLVEREIVVGELAEVREAGRDPRCAAPADRHRRGDLLPVRLAELAVRSSRSQA
jgi:hypothetical protein